jgi:hypothetical protein
MSYSSLINNPTYGQTYTLTNLAGSIPLAVSTDATTFTTKVVISPAGSASALFQSLPAGKYAVNMICAVESATANVTPLNHIQLQIVDDTDVSYGVSSSYGKTTSATLANKPANTIFINDTIFINLTTTKNLTLRLNYNILSHAGQTVSGNLVTNPAIVCENRVIFTEIL